LYHAYDLVDDSILCRSQNVWNVPDSTTCSLAFFCVLCPPLSSEKIPTVRTAYNHYYFIPYRTRMKFLKYKYPIIGLSILIPVVAIALWPDSRDRIISKAYKEIDRAKVEYTMAEKERSLWETEYMKLADQLEATWAKQREAELEQLCAQCRALHQRYIICNLGVPEICEDADQKEFAIINSWFGEIEDICYTDHDEKPRCVTDPYPF